MIFKLIVSSIFLFNFKAQAFDTDFKIESNRIPTEFSLLFESMKLEIKNQKDKYQMVGLIQEIGENLGFLEKEHIYFLLKSEVIKNVLEHKFDKTRKFDITSQFIERLEASLKSKEQYLNPFSKWIWRSIIAELNFRKKDGIISNKSFSINSFEGQKKIDAAKFDRYLRYLTPWIDRMESLPPAQFNKLSIEVSWLILERIHDRSIFFKRFATSLLTSTKTRLFNIPQKFINLHPEELKKIQNDTIPEELPLTEQAKKEKAEAETTIQKASIDDMSTVSDEVIKKIETKTD